MYTSDLPPLINMNVSVLQQLSAAITQLKQEEYAGPEKLLSGCSIGQHVRHILEFYQCLLNGSKTEEINYDLRQRDRLLETEPAYAIEVIAAIIAALEPLHGNEPLVLATENPVGSNNQLIKVSTTVNRELLYNMEHAIHHMAILRIAFQLKRPDLILDLSFGVAVATLRYQREHVHGNLHTS